MTCDVEAQDLTYGDKVLVEMKVAKKEWMANGHVMVVLVDDLIAPRISQVLEFHPEAGVEIHT